MLQNGGDASLMTSHQMSGTEAGQTALAAAGSAVLRSLPQVQVLVQLLFWGVFMGRIMAVAEAVLSSKFKDRSACSRMTSDQFQSGCAEALLGTTQKARIRCYLTPLQPYQQHNKPEVVNEASCGIGLLSCIPSNSSFYLPTWQGLDVRGRQARITDTHKHSVAVSPPPTCTRIWWSWL